jgi:hypothetical protein
LHSHNSIGVGDVRWWPKEQRVDQAKHRGIHANPDGEREDRDRGERWRIP